MSDLIRFGRPYYGVARIVMTRADRANARNNHLLYALDEALTAASCNPQTRMIILAGEETTSDDLKMMSATRFIGPFHFPPGFDPRHEWKSTIIQISLATAKIMLEDTRPTKPRGPPLPR